MVPVEVVSRAAQRLLLGAVASVALACSSQLAHSQRPATAAVTHASAGRAAASALTPSEPNSVETIRAEEAAPSPAPLPTGTPYTLEDPSGRAFEALHAALRRAQAGEGQARIVVYGASHVASDLFTGVLRQRLQHRFGEAGPGFVLLGKPWRWYRHAGIQVEESRNLRTVRIKEKAPIDGVYGLAGVALDALGGKPARAIVTTRSNGGLSGNASWLELYYLKQPRGGRIHLFIDGERMPRIDTSATHAGPGYAHFELHDGPHRSSCAPRATARCASSAPRSSAASRA